MSDRERIAELEAVLAQFLQPIRNIPFPLIIKSVSGHSVLPIDRDNRDDRTLIEQLAEVAAVTGEMLRDTPIRRNRPNEVGNDVEPFVMRAAAQVGLAADRPKGASGRGKTTGYPDILLTDSAGRPSYVECKIFGEGSSPTTMRSFYLSPSDDFKVTCDARHLLMAFEMRRMPIPASRDSFYTALAFKLVDLSGLKCDVKYEFNSDNRRLYHEDAILIEGPV